MSETLIAALVQAPFVLVIVYVTQRFLEYLHRRDEEWRSFMRESNERLGTRMSALTKAVNDLAQQTQEQRRFRYEDDLTRRP